MARKTQARSWSFEEPGSDAWHFEHKSCRLRGAWLRRDALAERDSWLEPQHVGYVQARPFCDPEAVYTEAKNVLFERQSVQACMQRCELIGALEDPSPTRMVLLQDPNK